MPKPPTPTVIREGAAISIQAASDELLPHDLDETQTLHAVVAEYRELTPVIAGDERLCAAWHRFGQKLIHLVEADRRENALHREVRAESRNLFVPDLPPAA